MKKNMRRMLTVLLILSMIVTICPQTQLTNTYAEEMEEPYVISYGRPVYVSSGNNEEYMVDNNASTRWESVHGNATEWAYVDLGVSTEIDSVYLHWEAAYAKSYAIQVSDDEENWKTIYTKGRVFPGDSQETESVEPQDINITYRSTDKTSNQGLPVILANWTSVSNAQYKVCVDTEDNVAVAPDGYKFNSHGPNQGEIALAPGEYNLIVIAIDKDTKAELGRGTRKVVVSEAGETVTEEHTTSAAEVPGSDPLKQTIDLTKTLNATERTGRYVRIYMTEKALPAYGYSLFEFQVYGMNGVVKRPANYGTNLALNKTVTCSGTRDEWWMYDPEGNMRPDAYANVKPENAVDGNAGTTFTSYQGDDQWLCVDLGQAYTLGRVIINWNSDAGKIYDVQVSADGQSWTNVHRVTKGYAYKQDNFTLYQQNVRYVRVFGYTKVESGSGFGISELSVYEYKDGDSQDNEQIEDLPVRQIINSSEGKGSYVSGEMYNEKNKLPTFINEENIKTPIDSNSWWSSAMVQTFSNLLCSTPLKTSFSKKGLGVLTATSGWVGVRGENDLGTDQSSETGRDFYIVPDNFSPGSAYDRVENYGDYSVQLGLMDENGLQMKSTVVKGSPYIFNEFGDNQIVFINSTTITEIFDGNGNKILANAKDEVTTDHFGFKSFDNENTKAKNDGAYYCVNLPEGTKVKAMVVGTSYKLKITFPDGSDNYMSVSAMTKKSDIEQYYQHGYAFVTDTSVEYSYNHGDSKISTIYTAETKVMRTGFTNVTMHALFPHQWKHSSDASAPVATYTSVRGDMKSIWANKFTTVQQFSGLLPTFATPDSDMFDSAQMVEFLNAVVASKVNTAPVSDAYWEGKNVHPLAISALMADQLGETEIRDTLLKKLKSIMVDWFTYDGGNDRCYLIYNKDWGTVYYPDSAYGANAAICDHHFTYGYFMFGAAVLATYDKQFLADYKNMVELLVRDYADPLEPEEDGNMFCKFRAFDQYSGHSWAGGYGDSDSGNNQESASEALFSWVGMYLWGLATSNDTYIDAGAYGFTTEMDAVEQYWFDYDETNWLPEYPFEATGQIYGASMGYGTYFGGQPVYIYGIQWLPISEYLTNYGMNQGKCAKIYQGLEDDTAYAIAIEKRLGNITNDDEYATPDNGWQHITWPFLSQTNPERAYEKFSQNVTKVQTEDRANTLWFISAMDQLGHRTNDYSVVGDIQGSVYKKDSTGIYTAQVWNPTSKTQTVTVKKADGTVAGTAKVGSMALVSFAIDTDNNFDLIQVATPTIKATPLSGGASQNISGEAVFDDTQVIELSCSESGAKIYYTTDGTVPTTESPVYNGKFLVSSDTTVKAVAIKDGYIDSAYAATSIKINGAVTSGTDNIARGKKVTASSESGAEAASKAVDGDSTTRWQGAANDDEYIQIDLGSTKYINAVKITWEAAYAAKYQIQTSLDGESWNTVTTVNGLAGPITTEFKATKARYVRMQGISRATAYGYSIFEFEVYEALRASAPTITPAGGNYTGAQNVVMTTDIKGAEIKYTLDGSEPNENSETYTEPIEISKSTVVKAITYRKGMLLSDVTESSIIIAGTIALNKASANIPIDGTIQLLAMTDETVTWTSSDPGKATVSVTGIVTGKNVGTATITATTFSGKTATCIINVTEPIHIQSISLSKSTLEMKNKTTENLELKINPADTTDDTTAQWTSSNMDVVTVNNKGELSAKSEGTATITVKIGNHTATCDVTVGPAATVGEMVADAKYNVALGKTATAYPGVAEGDIKYVTDGAFTAGGNHCALSSGWGYTGESYAIIDLGDTYDASTIDRIVVQYKDTADNDTVMNRKYNIEYSVNGFDFKTVYESDTITEFDENNCVVADVSGNTGAVKYVKIYYPQTANFGIQICEIGILSTEQNAKTVEVEKCDNPADFTVSSDNICEITYTITAGEGQDDYKYVVYLDNNKVTDLIGAGTGTIKNVAAGTHTVKVISYYDGKTSDGVTRTVEVDDGSLKAYVGTSRNLSKGAIVTVDSIEAEHEEGSKDPQTLTDGVISADTNRVVETTWGEKAATITIDLGQSIDKNSIHEVLLAFKAENTSATAYTIEFSDDGTNYQQVINVKGAKYKEAFEDIFIPAAYDKETVRYVKVKITDGNCNWGYQISEIAVMGTDSFMPIEAAGLVATSTDYNTVQVTWTGVAGQLYSVYIDNQIKSMNVVANTYTYKGISEGQHTVKVVAKRGDIESKGVTTTVNVEAAPTTKPTETPSAQKPTETTTHAKPTETSSQKPTETATQAKPTETSSQKPTETATHTKPTETSSQKPTETTTPKVGKTKVRKAYKKAKAKRAKISLKKIKKISGYQVKVSYTKSFKKRKTITRYVKKATFLLKVGKYRNRKKLYVKARAFKKVNGIKYFGKWSGRKRVRIRH